MTADPLVSDDERARATIRAIERVSGTGLTGLLGIRIVGHATGRLETELEVRDALLLGAGTVLHAGTVFSLADSTAGWGCVLSLPDPTGGFTTIEGKINLMATARAGDTLTCAANLIHSGRTTQVWDATVHRRRDERLIATYRCTQALLARSRVGAG